MFNNLMLNIMFIALLVFAILFLLQDLKDLVDGDNTNLLISIPNFVIALIVLIQHYIK